MSAKKRSELLDRLTKLRGAVLQEEKTRSRVALQKAPSQESAIHPKPEPSSSKKHPTTLTESGTILKALLSSGAHHKILAHTTDTQWSVDQILENLVSQNLHAAYPLITYRGVELARAGFYRAFDRVDHRPALELKSDLGEFIIRTRQENPEYRKWLEIYRKRKETHPEEKASEMCVFGLQQKLEYFEGDAIAKVIYPEEFVVDQVI